MKTIYCILVSSLVWLTAASHPSCRAALVWLAIIGCILLLTCLAVMLLTDFAKNSITFGLGCGVVIALLLIWHFNDQVLAWDSKFTAPIIIGLAARLGLVPVLEHVFHIGQCPFQAEGQSTGSVDQSHHGNSGGHLQDRQAH